MEKKFDMTAGDVSESQDLIEKNSKSNLVDEKEDPLKIVVEISDSSPIVILFGAKTSGKTMTLIRLARYLKEKGYIIEPDRTFRPSNSEHYTQMCDSFDENIFSDAAPSGTQALSFMLVKISNKHGDPICQVLEAPGEHFFDDETDVQFPPYLNQIKGNNNPKTWIFIVELDWKNQSVRYKYANRIKEMRNEINPSDRIVLMCHKADMKKKYYYKNNPDIKHFYRDVKQQYPAIFEGHKKSNPFSRLFLAYDMDFIVFSAGDFNETLDGITKTYTPSNPKYPEVLWKKILKTVKGSWF